MVGLRQIRKSLATPLSVKARKSRIRHASDSIDGTFLSTCIADYTDFVSFEKDAKVYIRELEKADDLGEASSGLFTEFITAVGDIWALLAPHEGKSAELFDKLLDKGHASWQKDAYGEKAPRAGEVCGNKPVEPEVVELMKPELSGPELLLHTTNLMIAEIECLQCAAKDAVILALENGSGIKIQKGAEQYQVGVRCSP